MEVLQPSSAKTNAGLLLKSICPPWGCQCILQAGSRSKRVAQPPPAPWSQSHLWAPSASVGTMSIAGVHQHRWSPPAFPAGWPRHACVIALSWEEAELREEMICKQRTTVDAPDSPAPHETGSRPHLIRRALAGLTSPCRAAATHIPSRAGLEQPRLLGQLWTLTGALLMPSLCANHMPREAPTPGAEAAGGSV